MVEDKEDVVLVGKAVKKSFEVMSVAEPCALLHGGLQGRMKKHELIGQFRGDPLIPHPIQ